jgi:hypothetical protein
MSNARIAWFYLREARGGMNAPKFLEMHRIGCIAMFKMDEGKIGISFSLAATGDRFTRKIGRDIALGKLCCGTERQRMTVINQPKDSADLIRQYPALYKALVRRVGTTLMTEKNDACLQGALKELDLVKA